MTRPSTMIAGSPATGLAVGIGKTKFLIEVRDFADASRVYRSAAMSAIERGANATNFPPGTIYDTRGVAPRVIATISWNGCVWAPIPWTPGQKALYDPAGPDARGAGAR